MNLIFRYFEFIATDYLSENFLLKRLFWVYKSIIQSYLKDSCTLIETIRGAAIMNGFIAPNKQTERKEAR